MILKPSHLHPRIISSSDRQLTSSCSWQSSFWSQSIYVLRSHILDQGSVRNSIAAHGKSKFEIFKGPSRLPSTGLTKIVGRRGARGPDLRGSLHLLTSNSGILARLGVFSFQSLRIQLLAKSNALSHSPWFWKSISILARSIAAKSWLDFICWALITI